MKKHVFLLSEIEDAPVQTKPVEGDESGLYVELTSKQYFLYEHESYQDLKESLITNFGAQPLLWDTELNKVVEA